MKPEKLKFGFKSRKEKDADGKVIMVMGKKEVKDVEGKVTGYEDTGKMVEKVIPAAKPVEVELPLLELPDIISIIESGDEKQQKLIVEAVNNIILGQTREQVNADPEEVRTKGLDLSKLTWKAIAEMPPATRKGAAIEDEVWEAFEQDYVNVMVNHGKTEEKAKTGAKLLVRKYQPIKLNKNVIKALQGNLHLWFANTSKQEEFQEVYGLLSSKADTLLEADEDALVAAV